MRLNRWLASLNLLPAVVLALGAWALPARYWPLDGLVAFTVAALLLSSGAVFLRLGWAPRGLLAAAWVLLVTGALLVAGFALSFAFLSGVQGPFGKMGSVLMVLVLLLLTPYTLLYPCLTLWWLRREARVAAPAVLRAGDAP